MFSAIRWTLLSADVRTLDAFHQKCLRQLLGIRWYDRVRNDEVLQRSGLTSLPHLLSSRRISVFGHVARLDDVTPANMALQLHIDISLNRPPDRTWRRTPGRPRNSWLDQLRNDSTRPTGELCEGVLSTVDMVVQRRDGPRPWWWWWWRWLSISCPVSCDWSVKCQHVGPCSRVLVTHYPRSLAVNADSVLYREPQLKSWPALRRMHLSIHLHRTSWYVCMSVCLSVCPPVSVRLACTIIRNRSATIRPARAFCQRQYFRNDVFPATSCWCSNTHDIVSISLCRKIVIYLKHVS